MCPIFTVCVVDGFDQQSLSNSCHFSFAIWCYLRWQFNKIISDIYIYVAKILVISQIRSLGPLTFVHFLVGHGVIFKTRKKTYCNYYYFFKFYPWFISFFLLHNNYHTKPYPKKKENKIELQLIFSQQYLTPDL